MDLTSLSWDPFMSFFIFCPATFFPRHARDMKQREFSLLTHCLQPFESKKNNVKDYTPPVIWSGPRETSLLFLSVSRPHLCGGALQMVGSTALGAKIPKLHICDNLKTQEWSYGNWLIISFLNRRTTRYKILKHTYWVSTHWDLKKKKKGWQQADVPKPDST